MVKSRNRTLLFVLVLFILLINISIFLFSLYQQGIISFNARVATSTASIQICINPIARLDNISALCGNDFYIHTNETHTCNITYNQSDNDTIIFWSYFSTSPEIFEIETDGLINYTTTPDSFGNNTAIIAVAETGHVCNNSQEIRYTYDFTLRLNNTPPEYFQRLPNVSMPRNSLKIPYHLNDYFRDIDEQPLTYTFLNAQPHYFNLTIDNVTSEVIIHSLTECGDFTLVFMAEDPYDAYATTSPSAKLSVSCPDEPEEESSGGGGGGGSFSECEEEWVCQEWSDCYPPSEDQPDYLTGYQKRLCYDQNGCDADNYQLYRYRECNYQTEPGCYPEWECTDWTPCRNDGTRERTCVDNNDCPEDDQIRFGIPETMELCVYLETCSDGVKNGDELGIDCGGSCEPCKTVEVASTIQDSNKVLTWAISILLILILFLTGSYWIFRKQIKTFFARLIWHLVKKSARQIYLVGNAKNTILNELKDYENSLIKLKSSKNIKDSDFNKLESNLYHLFRKVMVEILEIDLESPKNIVVSKIDKLDSTKEFKKMLLSITNKFIDDELNGRKNIIDKFNDISVDYNLLKFFIFNISDKIKKEFNDIKIDIKINNPMSNIMNIFSKSYVELQNFNLSDAKENYIKIINIYEPLDEDKKVLLYDETNILFNILTYLSSHIESK